MPTTTGVCPSANYRRQLLSLLVLVRLTFVGIFLNGRNSVVVRRARLGCSQVLILDRNGHRTVKVIPFRFSDRVNLGGIRRWRGGFNANEFGTDSCTSPSHMVVYRKIGSTTTDTDHLEWMVVKSVYESV